MLIPLLIPLQLPDCGHPADSDDGSTGDTGSQRCVGQLQIVSGSGFMAGNLVPIVEVIGTPEDPVWVSTGVIGDVDGDGLAEIGVQVGSTVRMLSGAVARAGGTLGPSSLPRVTDPASRVDWPVYPGGDLTGDGVPDLVVAASTGAPVESRWVELYSGAGLSSGALPVARIVYGSVHPIGAGGPPLVGDLDGDGVQDLVLARPWGSGVDTYTDGAVMRGPFAGERDVDEPDTVVGAGVWAEAIGDADGDGRDDLSASDEGGAYVFDGPTVSSRDVSASDARWTWAGAWPSNHLFEDLDGDGNADLLARVGQQSVVQSGASPAGAFELTITDGWAPFAGDLDGDGVPNLAFLEGSPAAATVSVFGPLDLDGGQVSSLDAVGSTPIPAGVGGFAAIRVLGDVDGDGADDLALVDPEFGCH